MFRFIIVNCLLLFTTYVNGQITFEEYYKKYFKDSINNIDPIEGVWSVDFKGIMTAGTASKSQNINQALTVVILKNITSGKYKSYFLNGDPAKFIFTKTASANVYLFQCSFTGTDAVAKSTAKIGSDGVIRCTFDTPDEALRVMYEDKYFDGFHIVTESKWYKTYPIAEENSNESTTEVSIVSGSCFAITRNGYLVTNDHVVHGAKSIIVKGINGDFSKDFSATIVIEDKINDLAIIRIQDSTFKNLVPIPYIINSSSSDVGENVFVLGYPFTPLMGDEIKLTTGVISSKTGFQGDVTTYQISAPIQPGNSGCPLFNSDGNVIGIINAKFSIAENAGYAIKTSYLKNLIDLLPNKPIIGQTNSIKSLPLTEKVKQLSKFVFIVECKL